MKRTLTVLILMLGLTASAANEAALDPNQTFDSNSNINEMLMPDFTGDDPPYYDYVYGPGRTVRWYDMGANRVPKILSENTIIEIDGRLINEIVIRALDNRVSVRSVVATLIDGRRVDLWNLTGTIRENRQVRARLDRYYSVRVLRLEIQASSPNLIGSRGSVQVFLGLAE